MWPRARAAWLEDLLYGVTNPGPDTLRLPGPGLVSGESLHVWETGWEIWDTLGASSSEARYKRCLQTQDLQEIKSQPHLRTLNRWAAASAA